MKWGDCVIDFSKDVVFVQDYVFNTQITEYDIQAAGLSILEASKALPTEKIEELKNIPKSSRVITIGMMIRDNPQLQKIISIGLAQARTNFITENHLSEADIVCIKKDAIFTTRKCNVLEFGSVHFRSKTKWRSYMKLGRIEFLFLDKSRYQVLGLGTVAIDYHKDGWISTIINIMDRVSNADRSVRPMVMNLISKYKSGSLDERYYHCLKSDPTVRDEMYNYKEIIIPLMQILSNVV